MGCRTPLLKPAAMAPEGGGESGLVETGGAGCLGGELGHLLDAGSVEVTALAVLLPEEASGLVAESAGAGGGFGGGF